MDNKLIDTIYNNDCNGQEPLLYLKQDELSLDEQKSLEQHLNQCDSCLSKYEEIQRFFDSSKFQPTNNQHQRLVNQIREDFLRLIPAIQKPSSNIIFRPKFKRLLVAASILFFLVFSIEQVSTISKISKLESRINQRTNASESLHHKGDMLALNHFISWDEIKSTAFPILNSNHHVGMSMRSISNKSWDYWQNELSPLEKRTFFIELAQKSTIDFPFIKMGNISVLSLNGIKSYK